MPHPQDCCWVLPENIQEVAADGLNHCIQLTYSAEADGTRTQALIEAILRKVPISQGECSDTKKG